MLSTAQADYYNSRSRRFSDEVRAVCSAWMRATERLRSCNQSRRGHQELARLSERELRDIGLMLDDLPPNLRRVTWRDRAIPASFCPGETMQRDRDAERTKLNDEVTIRGFTEGHALQVRQLFIDTNRRLSPPYLHCACVG
jgi:uncharacterized protein YjiS (DUF1127 family)